MRRLLIFLFLVFLMAPASAQLAVNVKMPSMKILGFIDTYEVGLGQAVVVSFKVTNIGQGMAKFDRAKIIIKDPNGKVRLNQFYNLGEHEISPGQSLEFKVKTDLVVDKDGVWSVTVQIYDGNKKLCEDTKEFRVVGGEVKTEITAINGIAVAGGISAVLGAIYLLRRAKV